MNDSADAHAELALSQLYDQYFAVVPANTPDLLAEAHALRYQVYCVEHAFEDPARQVGNQERDRYDDHSVHAVLIYRPSGGVVGCVRLILPDSDAGISHLPIRDLLSEAGRERLDRSDPTRTAEISRYAVSRTFRRRQGEHLFPDVDLDELPPHDARRLAPHISLGLIRGVATLACEKGITTLSAAMAPALMRLLQRFGLAFEPLGPLVDYHGIRQPCLAECEALLLGLASRHADYYRVVDAAYRGRLKP
jgi:N-acyl amino acid synthase of PEP-CTERM/exosortase system